jgi:hypothetical protein
MESKFLTVQADREKNTTERSHKKFDQMLSFRRREKKREATTATTKRTSRVFRGRPTSSSVEISIDATFSAEEENDDDDDGGGVLLAAAVLDDFVVDKNEEAENASTAVLVLDVDVSTAVVPRTIAPATADEQNFMVCCLEVCDCAFQNSSTVSNTFYS